ncbi:MAG: amino acid permease [Spirochaetes bacterium]|nr:amino acid permease [Spirochaetota bacterium]
MHLRKNLKLLEVFSLTTGAMLSSGIFLLPGIAYAKAGPSVFISYILAGLLAMTGMLSQAELSTAMPKSGGTYYYVTRSMGNAIGTVYGLITMIALVLKSAFALIGMATFVNIAFNAVFSIEFPPYSVQLTALFICIGLVLLNIIGTKKAGRIQVVFVFATLLVLIFYIFKGSQAITLSHFQSFVPNGTLAVFSTAGFVFVSYGGLLKIASIAEEIQNPGKVLPLGMILSSIVTIIVYALVVFVTVGVLNAAALKNSLMPLSDAAAMFTGPWGYLLLSSIAIIAFLSAGNAGIMGASRYPLALGRDNLLPGLFSRINAKFQTPHVSLIFIGVILSISLFMKLDVIIKAASTVLILTYIFSSLANIIMRESKLQNYQPKFHAPLYPWIQIICIIGCVFLLLEMGKEAYFTTLILILLGVIIFLIYGRKKEEREFALLHCIERITSRELTDRALETELKEVLRERDDIIKDRFDHLIEACPVLDIEHSNDVNEFFNIVAETMADSLKVKPKVLYKLLLEREKESSTVLTPGFAIPHIVIKGEKSFNILLARSKEGVYFSDEDSKVHAIFVLAGTKDERNFHLRALAAIAQIVQQPKFEKQWQQSKNPESLRDLVLLAERRR